MFMSLGARTDTRRPEVHKGKLQDRTEYRSLEPFALPLQILKRGKQHFSLSLSQYVCGRMLVEKDWEKKTDGKFYVKIFFLKCNNGMTWVILGNNISGFLIFRSWFKETYSCVWNLDKHEKTDITLCLLSYSEEQTDALKSAQCCNTFSIYNGRSVLQTEFEINVQYNVTCLFMQKRIQMIYKHWNMWKVDKRSSQSWTKLMVF